MLSKLEKVQKLLLQVEYLERLKICGAYVSIEIGENNVIKLQNQPLQIFCQKAL